TLVVLDSRGPGAFRAAMAMVAGTVVSAAQMLAVQFGFLPESISFATATKPFDVGLALSWLSIGSGVLVGLRINASMLAGTIFSWVIAPFVLAHYGVTNWVHAHNPAGSAKQNVLLWVMWPATGMLVAGGIAALIFRWKILMRTFTQLSTAKVSSS